MRPYIGPGRPQISSRRLEGMDLVLPDLRESDDFEDEIFEVNEPIAFVANEEKVAEFFISESEFGRSSPQPNDRVQIIYFKTEVPQVAFSEVLKKGFLQLVRK